MKVAKLFKNGESQAVRLPKEFRFAGDEVFIKRVGSAVVLSAEGEIVGHAAGESREVSVGLHERAGATSRG